MDNLSGKISPFLTMATARRPRALILGHSCIRRLGEFCCENGRANLGLDPMCVEVYVHCLGGAHVAGMWDTLGLIQQLMPQSITLQIGGRIPHVFVRADDDYNLSFAPDTNQILESHLNHCQAIPGARFWYHAKGLNNMWPDLYRDG